MSRPASITRRALLALPVAAGASLARGADGPARKRPLALQSLCLDMAQAGSRLVAVGERGHVLLSDDRGASWRQAEAVPTRTTLTAVHAVDAKRLWAAGHGGVLLRSDDSGERWSLVFGRDDGKEVLLSVRVEPGGHGLAVGAFGYAVQTEDGGATWQRVELVQGEDGERHLNRIFVSARSSWLIAAEGGLVLRRDAPRTAPWTAVKTPYAGSLWGGAALAKGTLLACGMRGNLLRSHDDGRSWLHQAVPEAGSFTAVAALADDRFAAVGVDGTLVLGRGEAQDVRLLRLGDRATLTAAIVLGSDALALGTASGPRVMKLPD